VGDGWTAVRGTETPGLEGTGEDEAGVLKRSAHVSGNPVKTSENIS